MDYFFYLGLFMSVAGSSTWKSLPFLRILMPFMAGILIAHYCAPKKEWMVAITIVCLVWLFLYAKFNPRKKFSTRFLQALFIQLLILMAGCISLYLQDIREKPNWIGLTPVTNDTLQVTLLTEPVEKEKSFKSIASVDAIRIQGNWKKKSGKLLLYFSKEMLLNNLSPETKLLIRITPQKIMNSGNPGSFDFAQYCAFQGIYHQAFIKPSAIISLHPINKSTFTGCLFRLQQNIRILLTKYIPGEKEAGVAEALLIGFRNDLDPELVIDYSKTGVVHIIAISGMHLGLIYGMLVFLCKPIRKKKWGKWLHPIILLAALWIFSLLTGASASILRAAVMFTFIILGESFERKSNTFNSLAASAFCLLVYNPYFLWDAGFLLSYTAVLGILIFTKPIYRLIYCNNQLLDAIWQLNAVTLSAQILTLPLVFYYFHQFPNYFLFTNFIAVPVSGLILYAELILLLISPLAGLCKIVGAVCSFVLHLMNSFIERTAQLPNAITDNIHMTIPETALLYIVITALAFYLFEQLKKGLLVSLSAMLLLIALKSFESIHTIQQHKIIVYNIPKQSALDIIEGNHCYLVSNIDTLKSKWTSMYLRPARIELRVQPVNRLNYTYISSPIIAGTQKTVLFLNKCPKKPPPPKKIKVDIVIVSENAAENLSFIAAAFNCSQYVFDSSIPLWKIQYLKKEAESLHLRHHFILEQGAFQVNI